MLLQFLEINKENWPTRKLPVACLVVYLPSIVTLVTVDEQFVFLLLKEFKIAMLLA